MSKKDDGWIGVDLDGTLAEYNGWKGAHHIGPPIEKMKKRVMRWLSEGREVRIFTARAGIPDQVPPVQAWVLKHFGMALTITDRKDMNMVALWDDRCVQVYPNTGETLEDRVQQLENQLDGAAEAIRGEDN